MLRRSLATLVAAVGIASSWPASAQTAVPSAESRAEARLDSTFRAHRAPAMSQAVSQKGRIVFSQSRGFADLENEVPASAATVYDIGSVSKILTAVAVMQLVEKGRVSLADPIQKYVPSFPEKSAPITIRHLMTHTSGIRHYRDTDFPGTADNENLRPYTSFEDAITIFKDDPLLFAPGRYFAYTSYGVNLLQGVVEKAGDLPFEEYLRRNVWDPAGMSSTQFDVPSRIVPHRARSYVTAKDSPVRNVPYGDLTYKFASGGMMSTAEDLVRFASALNAGKLLRPETRAAMWTPQTGLIEFRDGKPTGVAVGTQALLWRVAHDDAGRRFVYHCGSVQQFQTCLVNYPDSDVVVAMLANSFDSTGWKENLAVAEFFLGAGRRR
jgi:serine beta-lactamase-like protein LACTB, mitochondrial